MQDYFESPAVPLESFLLFSLLPDFWELFLIVLPCFALLGFPAWIIFYPVHFLLPCLHQLIVTLTDFLLLLNSKSKPWTEQNTPSDQYMSHGQAPGILRFFLLQSLSCWRWLKPNFQHRKGEEVDTKIHILNIIHSFFALHILVVFGNCHYCLPEIHHTCLSLRSYFSNQYIWECKTRVQTEDNHMLLLENHGALTRCFLAWFLLLKNRISFFLITWFLGNKIRGQKWTI